MVIMLSWTTVILCNLTANLHFSGKMTKGKCCVFPIDFFFPFPFADGDHVDFCQFKKAGLNKSTEILIPWAGLSSQWQWPHWTCTVLTSHCSCFIFGNLMLSSDFRGSRSGKACSAVLDVLLKTSEDIGLLLVWEKIPREISNGVFFRTQAASHSVIEPQSIYTQWQNIKVHK